MSKYNIELGSDTEDVAGFSAFLRKQGHTVTVCGGTRFYIDGASATSRNGEVYAIRLELEAAYKPDK